MTIAREAPRNVTAVGGLVVGPEGLLAVRLNYGPSRGRFTLPGGRLDPGETLDVAVAREVREETGVEARPLSIIGVRSRFDGTTNDTYVLWLLEPVGGALRPDGREVSECCYLTFEETETREDVTDLVRYLARRVRDGDVRRFGLIDDYTSEFPSRDHDAWKLFM